MAEVRGTVWLTLCDYLRQRFGPDALDPVISRLTAADAEVLRRKILPVSWLDYGLYTRFLIAADDALGKGDRVLIRDAAVHHARKDMHGVYRMFMRVATPGFLLRRAPLMWKLMINRGELRVVHHTARSVDLEITDIDAMPPHHELDELPFIEEIARMAGAKNVRCTHPKCLARGDDICRYAVVWE